MTDKDKELGLFVDGVRQTPVETNVVAQEGMSNNFDLYKVELPGEILVIFYLDPHSLVNVNAELYTKNAHRMNCTNDSYSIAILQWCVSQDDLFLGNSRLYGILSTGCEFLNAEVATTASDREPYRLLDAKIATSYITDTQFNSPDVEVTESILHDTSIECGSAKIFNTSLENSSVAAKGALVIGKSTVADCVVHAMESELFIADCKLHDIEVRLPRVSLLNVFHTFEIEFPLFTIRFVRMAKGDYALCSDGGWWVKLAYKDVIGRILDYISRYKPEWPEDTARYILDCAESRKKVIESLEDATAKVNAMEYLRLSAVC